MKFVVGLGNPGRKYSQTRHNVGFALVEELAARFPVEKEESRFDALLGHIRINGERVVLVKPLTFMNLSGQAVQPLLHWYKADLADLLVIYDDMDLPCGTLRIRAAGGSGGHRGITSIINRLGSRDFPRIRIGIGRPPGEAVDWVLGKFLAEEKELVNGALEQAARAVEYWVAHGIERTMNEYN